MERWLREAKSRSRQLYFQATLLAKLDAYRQRYRRVNAPSTNADAYDCWRRESLGLWADACGRISETFHPSGIRPSRFASIVRVSAWVSTSTRFHTTSSIDPSAPWPTGPLRTPQVLPGSGGSRKRLRVSASEVTIVICRPTHFSRAGPEASPVRSISSAPPKDSITS
jgi:hypothetical protein